MNSDSETIHSGTHVQWTCDESFFSKNIPDNWPIWADGLNIELVSKCWTLTLAEYIAVYLGHFQFNYISAQMLSFCVPTKY